MGAVEDGRRERGLEGMGWGLGRVGWARDVRGSGRAGGRESWGWVAWWWGGMS